MSRDFRSALMSADAQLVDEPQLRAMRARLDARLFRPAKPSSRWLPVLVAVSSVFIGFVAVRALAPQPVPVIGGFEVAPAVESSVRVSRQAAVEIAAEVSVVDRSRGVTISSITRSTVRREARGIRMLEGRATFDVQKRTEENGVVRVLVSGGSIEVHGTRFTVTENGTGTGSVELHEGVIDFIDENGNTRRMRPGDLMTWPRAVEPPSVIDTPADEEIEELTPLGPVRRKKVTPKKPTDIDWRPFDQRVHAQAVITELSTLRQNGQWQDAVRLLERELNRGAPDTRERLSFELGLIYTWQLKDPLAACAHWKQHQREYPEGRFDVEIDRASQSLGCTQ
ncbi:MAG: FecR domain-containing protein [Archangium sp.]|nr:FecR domain-containing protein [Archangium sp.]